MAGRVGQQRGDADLPLEPGPVQSGLAVEEPLRRQFRGMQGDRNPIAGEGWDHRELVANPVEAPRRRRRPVDEAVGNTVDRQRLGPARFGTG